MYHIQLLIMSGKSECAISSSYINVAKHILKDRLMLARGSVIVLEAMGMVAIVVNTSILQTGG